ncbi:hypothetical protein CR513_27689, partial [Mucuna pruriens]
MNGAVKAANKNIKEIVQKMVVTFKDWHDMLPYALHGYRTSVCTSIGATPYSLVYGTKAVLLVEVEIPSLRVLAEAELTQIRLDRLNLIEEKRLTALCHGQLYQRIIKYAFDIKVRPYQFKEGDLMLKKILLNARDPRGKWTPNYEGPYIVKRTFFKGALILDKSSSIQSTSTRSNCSTLESSTKGRNPNGRPRVSKRDEPAPPHTRESIIDPLPKGIRPKVSLTLHPPDLEKV